MKPTLIQKVYTFPERKFYGEYDLFQLAELRLAIVKGEIKEQLCYILSNDRAVVLDKFGIPDFWSDELIEVKHTNLLKEMLRAQMDIRIKETEI